MHYYYKRVLLLLAVFYLTFCSTIYKKESDSEIQMAIENEDFDRLEKITAPLHINNLPQHYLLENAQTALHIGATQNSRPVILLLLKLGEKLDAKDDRGNTALFYALQSGSCESLETLIVKGANPYIPNYKGNSVLAEAIVQNQLECTEILLFNKVKPNDKLEHGKSLLSFSQSRKNKEMIKLLKEHGAK